MAEVDRHRIHWMGESGEWDSLVSGGVRSEDDFGVYLRVCDCVSDVSGSDGERVFSPLSEALGDRANHARVNDRVAASESSQSHLRTKVTANLNLLLSQFGSRSDFRYVAE